MTRNIINESAIVVELIEKFREAGSLPNSNVDVHEPTSFYWRGTHYHVMVVEDSWHNGEFEGYNDEAEPIYKSETWLYLARVEDSLSFELFRDSNGNWTIISQEVDD